MLFQGKKRLELKTVNLNNRVENSARNAMVGIVAQCIQMISTFVCRMIFVRCLNSEYLGVSGLFTNVLSMLSVAELGVGSAITFELYKVLAEDDQEQIASLMLLYRKAYHAIGIVIGICGLGCLPFIKLLVTTDTTISENIYILFLLYLAEVVVSYFFSYKQSIIEVAQQNYIVTIVDVFTGVIRNIIQCVILLITHNFLLYLIVQVLLRVVFNIIISGIADQLFPVIKRHDAKELPKEMKKRMFRNIRYVFVPNILGKLMSGTDNIIITALGGLAVTGLNSNYSLIISTIITFTTKIQRAISASVGNINAVESDENKLNSFYEVFLIYFWMYFWCATCYILLIQDTIEIFFGKQYVLPMKIGIITALNFMYQEHSTCRSAYHSTMGLFKYGRYVSMISNPVNIILSVFLGKMWGLFGVLLATLLSRMMYGWYSARLTFKYGFKKSVCGYYVKVCIYWGTGAAILGITWLLCELPQIGNMVMDLIYRMVICFSVPNALFFIAFSKTKEMGRVKTKILRYLRCHIKEFGKGEEL